MDEDKKKPIMIAVIVVCLVVAGFMLKNTFFGGSKSGVSSIDPDETTQVPGHGPDPVEGFLQVFRHRELQLDSPPPFPHRPDRLQGCII